jgi:hypothetical protein
MRVNGRPPRSDTDPDRACPAPPPSPVLTGEPLGAQPFACVGRHEGTDGFLGLQALRASPARPGHSRPVTPDSCLVQDR